jgi:hypothetical protein
MKKAFLITNTLVLLAASAVAQAGDADALIALDKQWGEARDAATLNPMLADDLLAVSPAGMGDKAQIIADATAADAPDAPYTVDDYTVKFLSDEVAVMTHSVSGDEAHWSMHVWQKQGGAWKVAATASIPAAE